MPSSTRAATLLDKPCGVADPALDVVPCSREAGVGDAVVERGSGELDCSAGEGGSVKGVYDRSPDGREAAAAAAAAVAAAAAEVGTAATWPSMLSE